MNQVSAVSYRIGEVVWAKIRGSPHCPARINWLNGRYTEVTWFNDYRRTKVFRTQLFKFLQHFDQFAGRFNDTVGLKAAAQEGLIYFGNTMNKI